MWGRMWVASVERDRIRASHLPDATAQNSWAICRMRLRRGSLPLGDFATIAYNRLSENPLPRADESERNEPCRRKVVGSVVSRLENELGEEVSEKHECTAST